jgi:hypothetical protein
MMNGRIRLKPPSVAPGRTNVLQRGCTCGAPENLACDSSESRYVERPKSPLANHIEPTVASTSVCEVRRSAGELHTIRGKECTKKRTTMQRSASNTEKLGADPLIVHNILSSPDQPFLDVATRPFKESRHDRMANRSHRLRSHR